jgi:hypothetical protein
MKEYHLSSVDSNSSSFNTGPPSVGASINNILKVAGNVDFIINTYEE